MCSHTLPHKHIPTLQLPFLTPAVKFGWICHYNLVKNITLPNVLAGPHTWIPILEPVIDTLQWHPLPSSLEWQSQWDRRCNEPGSKDQFWDGNQSACVEKEKHTEWQMHCFAAGGTGTASWGDSLRVQHPQRQILRPRHCSTWSTQARKAAGVHICLNRTLGLKAHKWKSCCTDWEGVEIMQITKADILTRSGTQTLGEE